MYGLLSLAVIAGMVEFADSCSCFPMSLRQKYCKTDYVVEVRVLSELINDNGLQDFDDYYQVDVLSELKPNETIADMSRVYTGSNGAMCGVQLRNNTEYIIGGRLTRRGNMSLDLCRSIITRRKKNGRLPKLLRKAPKCREKSVVG